MSAEYFEELLAAARELVDAEDAWQKTGADMPTTFAFLEAEEALRTIVSAAPRGVGDGDTHAARLFLAAKRSVDADVCGRNLSPTFDVKEAEAAFQALRTLVSDGRIPDLDAWLTSAARAMSALHDVIAEANDGGEDERRHVCDLSPLLAQMDVALREYATTEAKRREDQRVLRRLQETCEILGAGYPKRLAELAPRLRLVRR